MVKRFRLQLFGHVLRLSRNAPAQQALDFYFVHKKPRMGRPKTCLFSVLAEDCARKGLTLKSPSDLEKLRSKALNKKWWSLHMSK